MNVQIGSKVSQLKPLKFVLIALLAIEMMNNEAAELDNGFKIIGGTSFKSKNKM